MSRRISVSLVVPVLNEATQIAESIDAARELGWDEIIVVDGGSADDTIEIVKSSPQVRLVRSRRGRAAQMNAGARAAKGDVICFLHADARLPDDAVNWIVDTMRAPDVVGGAFRTWTVCDEVSRPWWRPLLHLADVRSRLTRLPYGDQAMFVCRSAFQRVGGYPPQPLMEDVELSRALWRLGRLVTVPARVQVSGRRFLARPLYYTALMHIYPWLYRLGVSAETLNRWYADVR